jgi:hypothetical protein
VHVGAPHVPESAPGSLLQSNPVQQSSAVVHEPPEGMHATAQRSVPVLSATQGLPQQSAEDAHVVPGGGFTVQSPTLFMRHRGMLSASRWQHISGWLLQVPDFSPGGSQQSLLVLHEVLPPVLQICPAWLHALAWLEHCPNSSVVLVFAHVSPQQSVSARQSSPTGWHPDGFWQTLLPF